MAHVTSPVLCETLDDLIAALSRIRVYLDATAGGPVNPPLRPMAFTYGQDFDYVGVVSDLTEVHYDDEHNKVILRHGLEKGDEAWESRVPGETRKVKALILSRERE